MAESSNTKDQLQRFLRKPSISSLALALLLFAVCVGFLHPRYAINDDLKVISLITGYPAGNPAPFVMNMNVLYGLLLVPLYALGTPINWEIWLFLVLDLLSVWALLYVLFAPPIAGRAKLVGSAIILACGSYFCLNITFTNAAALADFAGLCLILTYARAPAAMPRLAVFFGGALIVAGGMIRVEVLALTLPIILTAMVFLFPSLRIRRLVVALAVTGTAVFAAYAFDRLYVRSHPDWNAYYHYNRLAQMIRDTHRLANAGFIIKRISWSSNDQELFARLFFPDSKIYAVDRLQYIVDHVLATGPNPMESVRELASRLISGMALSMLLLAAAAWLLSLAPRPSVRRTLGIAAIVAVSLAENAAITWLYKDPDYSLLALLANTAVLALLVLYWPPEAKQEPAATPRIARLAEYAGLLLVMVAVVSVVGLSITSSKANANLRVEYKSILSDISQLQAEGRLAPDAIIVSPSHGLPWDWSNPLLLELPPLPFLDTGWSTFSPSYNGALQHFSLEPLPQALYKRDNVYLMTKQIFQGYLARYYEEHEHVSVTFEPIYNMPNPYHIAAYDNIQLYKVVLDK